jgi:hypothetical protein
VPRPDPEYLRFRLETMYGGAQPGFRSADVVAYLAWCRRFPDHRNHGRKRPNREKPRATPG